MITAALRRAFDREWLLAMRNRAVGNHQAAFAHLERAHILGQRHTWLHFKTHAAMFLLGWRLRSMGELLGQPPRMLAALLFSRIWVPVGNTGGANVSAFKPMPIPADLRALLDQR